MEGLDFDPGRFAIVNPLWYVSCRGEDGLARYGMGCGDDAGRFAARSKLPGAIPVEVPDPVSFLHLLYEIHEGGHELLAIDPEAGRPLRTYSTFGLFCGVRDSVESQQ